MRSFVAGFVLFLSFLSGTAAVEAYVVHEVLLDPERAGEVLGSALQQPELRDKILSRAVPGYAQLPTAARAGVDRAAEEVRVDQALRNVQLGEDGTVPLAPLKTGLADELRRQGQGRLADLVEAAESPETVTVPPEDMDRYTSARDTTWKVAVGGGLITVGLLLIAAIVSPDRRRTIRSIGVTVLLVAGAAALLYAALPTAVRAADARPEFEALAAVVEGQRSTAWLTLLPVAVVGVVLVVASLLMPRAVRRRYDDRSAS
jgi:hypothetical protein